MKQIAGFFFSSRLMVVIMAMFAISIATATFIEKDFGNATARLIVYNAHWFELLLLLGAINLTGRIFINRLYERPKIPILVFHLSFVIILAGSAITRYTGFEGTMFIREGQRSSQFLTSQAYIQVKTVSRDQVAYNFPVSFNALGRNKFSEVIRYNGKTCRLSCKSFIQNAATQQTEGLTSDELNMEISDNQHVKKFILRGRAGNPGIAQRISFDGAELLMIYGSVYKQIPFKLKLDDFILNRYPGSQSPSWFESRVTLLDASRHYESKVRIYMNNILKYRGYRFYQSSYDPDEKGTVLSVNRDFAGTVVTYAGYLLMALGMALSLFSSKGRFRKLSEEINSLKAGRKAAVLLILLLAMPGATWAINAVPEHHAKAFGELLVQDYSGRIEPVNTLSSEILRKLYRKSMFKELNADQVLLGMLADPEPWMNEPIIRASHPQILEIMNSDAKYFAFASFFRDDQYVLKPFVEEAYRKRPAARSKFDNEIIRLNERVSICYMVISGELLRVLPVPGDSSHTWCNQQEIQGKVNNEDSVIIENILTLYFQDVQKSLKTGDWKEPDQIVRAIGNLQNLYSKAVIPSPGKIRIEILLNRTDIFATISGYYGLIGFILLILQFAALLNTRFNPKIAVSISLVLILILFTIHTAGLGMRWYVAGHAPWSNGYEALTYVAWATVLAGLIFASRSSITLSATAILAFLILHTAHLSWMDPQITQLTPVLKSYWLVIHVATITASYGFLFMGALLAYINFLLMIMQTRGNTTNIRITIQETVRVTEMSLIVGLYLLTIGAFLGGVWANESWGRYWGWDPKETWALVTIIVYAFVLHMRMVPGLQGLFAFNLAALLSIGAVIMTYFGVNYYLSGLHSYAKGDPLPVPAIVYYTVSVILFTVVLAYFRNKKTGARDSRDMPWHVPTTKGP